jgi:hypothetical protein
LILFLSMLTNQYIHQLLLVPNLFSCVVLVCTNLSFFWLIFIIVNEICYVFVVVDASDSTTTTVQTILLFMLSWLSALHIHDWLMFQKLMSSPFPGSCVHHRRYNSWFSCCWNFLVLELPVWTIFPTILVPDLSLLQMWLLNTCIQCWLQYCVLLVRCYSM